MRVGEVEFEAGTRIWGALSSAGSLRERPTPNPARFVGSGVDVYPNLSQSASLPTPSRACRTASIVLNNSEAPERNHPFAKPFRGPENLRRGFESLLSAN
jgi:hypothetical protein